MYLKEFLVDKVWSSMRMWKSSGAGESLKFGVSEYLLEGASDNEGYTEEEEEEIFKQTVRKQNGEGKEEEEEVEAEEEDGKKEVSSGNEDSQDGFIPYTQEMPRGY
jgi:hypothetical protein